jgi:uncharacterized protein
MGAGPLTDAEYDRLTDILDSFSDENAMNLEELDGFIAALVSGPSRIQPTEYLPKIWGGAMPAEVFSNQQEQREFSDLVARHHDAIAHTLQSGDVFLPVLLEDEQGVTPANDWAHGFLRGMELRRRDWGELLGDDEHGGWLVPIFALAHEHNPDPTMRPYKEPMDAERRERLIIGVAAGVTAIYQHFEPHRQGFTSLFNENATFRRAGPKVGRSDPCPCGSGKKFKQCCGRPTLH